MNKDSGLRRQNLVGFLKSQVQAYKDNPEMGEQIAYSIVGMMSDDFVRSLPDDDPCMQIMEMAGELELPAEHRSDSANWDNLIQKIEDL